MLLIDGVKYELWTPPSEEEFERVVKEHAAEIFGEQSIYLDLKQKLKSASGIGSIPDAYVIVLGEQPEWHIVEVELSNHPLDQHIVSQVGRFITGINNPNIQRGIVSSIYLEITNDDFLKLNIEKSIKSKEIHYFLDDLISKPPVLTVIIEKDTQGLREILRTLAHPQIKVVEFQTFMREDVGLPVHAHLFKPLCTSSNVPPPIRGPIVLPPISASATLEITIHNPTFKKFHLFYIPKDRRSFFPGFRIPFILETDIGTIETYVVSAPAGTPVGDPNAGYYIQAKLANWYRRHSDIKVGDRVLFRVIEPMKKYRLEIVR